ncbi:hypothetical protein GGS24DRAFT_182785 [Hypoxylon argillaceum]|nr:hypothetical protein GGS24DRAFT_182785 [Hypoxylon argillaceum]
MILRLKLPLYFFRVFLAPCHSPPLTPPPPQPQYFSFSDISILHAYRKPSLGDMIQYNMTVPEEFCLGGRTMLRERQHKIKEILAICRAWCMRWQIMKAPQ